MRFSKHTEAETFNRKELVKDVYKRQGDSRAQFCLCWQGQTVLEG